MNTENTNETNPDPESESILKTFSAPEAQPPTVVAPAPSVISAPPVANGEFTYFKKVMNAMPFFANGARVNFESLDRNFGVLKIATTDPLTPILNAAATARRGGIVLIDLPTYEDLKKKLPFKPLGPKLPQSVLRVLPTDLPRPKPRAGGPAAAAVDPATTVVISGRPGVWRAGGVGAGNGAGTPLPVPVPPPTQFSPPGEFKPATGSKTMKMPVTKKTSSRSLEGGIDESEPGN